LSSKAIQESRSARRGASWNSWTRSRNESRARKDCRPFNFRSIPPVPVKKSIRTHAAVEPATATSLSV
jgi:hypothetical protein